MSDGSIDSRLGRIEGKVEGIHSLLEQNIRDVNREKDIIGKRIRSLERSRSWITGVLAVTVSAGGWFGRNLGG